MTPRPDLMPPVIRPAFFMLSKRFGMPVSDVGSSELPSGMQP